MARQFLDVTEAEDLALQSLYTATTGASWHDNTNWDGATAGDCYGITVAGGVVTALDLRANNLDGEFTAAVVSALTSCATIHVEGNPNLNVSFNLDDLPASVTDFVADYTDSDLAGGSSAMSAVDIEEISIRSASLSSLSVADIIDRIYADRASFNHADPILRIDNLEDETLAYLATHGVSRTPAEIAAINANIKAIKAGTPVVLSSLTAKLSLIDGTAFVTQSSVDLRPYKDFKLSFSDGSQSLVGWAKAYGTGETLDTEKLDEGGFENFTGTADDGTSDTFTGWNHFGVNDGNGDKIEATETKHGGSYAAKLTRSSSVPFMELWSGYGDIAVVAGELLKFSVWTRGDGSVAGSTGHYDRTNGAWIGAYSRSTGISGTSYAQIGYYFNPPVGCSAIDTHLELRANGTIYYDDASIKKVLTPDTTGLVIVSASGGSTENWTSDGGIDPNAASFTLTITNS